MEKIITTENLSLFTYSNEHLLEGAFQGIAVEFHGLGSSDMKNDDFDPAFTFAREKVLYLYPYYEPWGWMNDECVAYVDEIIDVVLDKYHLPKDYPVASVGGSMGGMGAFRFAAQSKHHIVCCAANAPVCDFVYHYSERNDVPHTAYHALFHFEGTLDEALRSISPYHNVEKLPKIPYYVVHGDVDCSVNKKNHSDRMVQKMKENGLDVTYCEMKNMPHTRMSFEDALNYYMFSVAELRRNSTK